MANDLDRKCAERDALFDWLQALETEGACPEAKAMVQAQLDRVLHDIERLKEQVG